MDWALLPLSTKGYLVRWSCESEVRFHGACRPRCTFPLFQAWSLRNTAWSLVRDLTVAWLYKIRGLVQNFHLSVTCHRHTGRSWYPPPVLSGPCERSYQVYTGWCLCEMASWWMLCILSRESIKQTVQPFKGIWCIQRWLSSGGTKKGERVSSYLAMVTASSTLA